MVRRVWGAPIVFALAPLLAFRLRLVHLRALEKTPLFHHLIGDSLQYDTWAQQLAGGDWMYGSQPYYQDPLYPYFLAALYRLFGHDLFLVRAVQLGLSVATCVLVGLLARRLAGPAAGTTSAFAWALFRTDIFNVGEVDKTVLGVFLVSLSLVMMVGSTRKERFVSGLAMGLAALTRGNLLAVAPLVALVYLWPERAKWRAPLKLFGTAAGQGAVLFVFGFALALAPVTARNVSVSGQLVLTTSGLGPTFYTGNSPFSDSGGFEFLPFVRADPLYEATDFTLEAERRVGHPLSPTEVSRYWFKEAVAYIAAHPMQSAGRWLKKLWLIFNDFEAVDMIDPATLARYSPVLSLPLFSVGWFSPLALLAVFALRRDEKVRQLALWVGAFCAALAGFFVLARYRVMVVPALVPLAAVGGGWLLARVAERAWREAAVAGAAVLAMVALFFWPPQPKEIGAALGPINIAGIFAAEGNLSEAHALLERAAQAAPNEPAAWCALGEQAATFHQWAEARGHAERCLKADARHRGAWLLMGRVEEASGQFDRAAEAYKKQLELIPGEQEATLRLEGLSRARPTPEPAQSPREPSEQK
jgi:4-amino-4-deoxy-L-arabinose transferase-like glycosyltransferase